MLRWLLFLYILPAHGMMSLNRSLPECVFETKRSLETSQTRLGFLLGKHLVTCNPLLLISHQANHNDFKIPNYKTESHAV